MQLSSPHSLLVRKNNCRKQKFDFYRYEYLSAKGNDRKWDIFISNNIEYDNHGHQTKAYKILKELNKYEKDNLCINIFLENQQLDYYQELCTAPNKATDIEFATNNAHVDNISMEELMSALKNSKNRKLPGSDGIHTELFKYALTPFPHRFLDLINICWKFAIIPTDWNELLPPIFKKRNRK